MNDEQATQLCQKALKTLLDQQPLDQTTSEQLFLVLLNGQLDEAQIGALLALIQTIPPSAETLTGAARAMRAHVEPVQYTCNPGEVLIDTCGTGGAPKSFNVSTASAIVAASVTPPSDSETKRIVVAKHGNRSRTGRGSAEVLMSLGVKVDASPKIQSKCLREAGVCFCFAIHHHPAMKYAMGPRRSLGFPTIFNALGPLTNPAGADRQLIGVYDNALVEPIAQTLSNLGATRAMVVHAYDGLDELSTTAPTKIIHVQGSKLSQETIDSPDLGLNRSTLNDLQATSVEQSAEIITDIFAGIASPYMDMVLLTTAGALLIANACNDLQSGVELARESIAQGHAKTTLDRLIEVSHSEEG
jgi:anthranilate phosphoribosyltransferase